MVQTTFTKQKRELEKAVAWIEKIRAQEVRQRRYNERDELEEEIREAYVDHSPEEIAHKAIAIVREVVSQHAARQQANSVNRGTFAWGGIAIELTVPQLRTLQGAHIVFKELVDKLPRRNPKLVYNTTINRRPAFAHIKQKHEKTEIRYRPYEEESSNRIRTYEEKHQVTSHYTQKVEIDYGIEINKLTELTELVNDLGTAIQIAIDDANTKGRTNDPVVDNLIEQIGAVLLEKLPISSAIES
jgi:hypothetical protein